MKFQQRKPRFKKGSGAITVLPDGSRTSLGTCSWDGTSVWLGRLDKLFGTFLEWGASRQLDSLAGHQEHANCHGHVSWQSQPWTCATKECRTDRSGVQSRLWKKPSLLSKPFHKPGPIRRIGAFRSLQPKHRLTQRYNWQVG